MKKLSFFHTPDFANGVLNSYFFERKTIGA